MLNEAAQCNPSVRGVPEPPYVGVKNPNWVYRYPEPDPKKAPEYPKEVGKQLNDAMRRNIARENLVALAGGLAEAVTLSKEFLSPADKREFGGLLKEIVNLIGE